MQAKMQAKMILRKMNWLPPLPTNTPSPPASPPPPIPSSPPPPSTYETTDGKVLEFVTTLKHLGSFVQNDANFDANQDKELHKYTHWFSGDEFW